MRFHAAGDDGSRFLYVDRFDAGQPIGSDLSPLAILPDEVACPLVLQTTPHLTPLPPPDPHALQSRPSSRHGPTGERHQRRSRCALLSSPQRIRIASARNPVDLTSSHFFYTADETSVVMRGAPPPSFFLKPAKPFRLAPCRQSSSTRSSA
jgi:hypothetical protein